MTLHRGLALVAVAGALGVSACTVAPPDGPSFAAMPGQGKTYVQFRQDDAVCRQTAAAANGNMTPGQGATQSAVGSAAVGTGVGAIAGALLGAAAGNAGAGAALGAGAGLLGGSAVGAGSAQVSADALQRNYDVTYAQCMVAAGESVPNPSGPPPSGYPAYPGYGYAPPMVYAPPPMIYGPPIGIGLGFGFGGGWGGGYRRW